MNDVNQIKEQHVDVQQPSRGIKPLVFISHDTRDAELAEAFSRLLSSVSAGVLKSFRSSDKRGNQGIAYGVEWYPEIMKKLGDASDVVALLTHNSVDRPWILYEAGVAKGKLETPLLGVAIGIPLNKVNDGPFAQFQNSGDDVDSLTKLVVQLVNRIPNSEPDIAVIKMQVETFKMKADEILKMQPLKEVRESELMEDSSVAKLFEEVKIMFKDLPSRIERNINPSFRKRKHRLHPKVLEEFLFTSKNQEDGYVSFLMLISLFKEDMPWIYEVGKETYEVIKSPKFSISSKQAAILGFKRLVKNTIHNPLFVDMMESDEQILMFERVTFFIEEYMIKFSNITKE